MSGFQIKDFASIVAAQINHARSVTTKVTDFAPGSAVRTIIEAPAVEIEELYMQMFLGLRDAIPVATFLSFGFELLPAAFANGTVSISADTPPTADITIPAGTIFTATSDGRTYASTESVTWVAGEAIVYVPVQATVEGLGGNASVGVVDSSGAFSTGYTVSNSEITTGKDAETLEEREARFADFVQSLSRGTVYACLYQARQSVVKNPAGGIVEYVTRSSLVEDAGHVRIYLFSNLGEPSIELLADGQTRIDGEADTPGYRAAGVRMDVLAMTQRTVPFSVKVGMLTGYTLNSTVIQALGDIYSSEVTAIEPGGTLYLGEITEAMLAVPGVATVVPQTGSNIVCGESEALAAGTLTVAPL